MLRGYRRLQADSTFRINRQQVLAAIQLPELPAAARRRGGIWAVGMVKNESDIVERVVRHLLEQDVDGILLADNNSSDGTLEMLQALAVDLPVHIALDRHPAHHQSVKTGVLARWATAAGARWIIPFDGDEFWFAEQGTLGSHLRRATTTVEVAHLHNLLRSSPG